VVPFLSAISRAAPAALLTLRRARVSPPSSVRPTVGMPFEPMWTAAPALDLPLTTWTVARSPGRLATLALGPSFVARATTCAPPSSSTLATNWGPLPPFLIMRPTSPGPTESTAALAPPSLMTTEAASPVVDSPPRSRPEASTSTNERARTSSAALGLGAACPISSPAPPMSSAARPASFIRRFSRSSFSIRCVRSWLSMAVDLPPLSSPPSTRRPGKWPSC
jgi:hypothetical protein